MVSMTPLASEQWGDTLTGSCRVRVMGDALRSPCVTFLEEMSSLSSTNEVPLAETEMCAR